MKIENHKQIDMKLKNALTQEQKKEFDSLVRLGDSQEMALWSVLYFLENIKENQKMQNSEMYTGFFI